MPFGSLQNNSTLRIGSLQLISSFQRMQCCRYVPCKRFSVVDSFLAKHEVLQIYRFLAKNAVLQIGSLQRVQHCR
jgi:hypothetical protein